MNNAEKCKIDKNKQGRLFILRWPSRALFHFQIFELQDSPVNPGCLQGRAKAGENQGVLHVAPKRWKKSASDS